MVFIAENGSRELENYLKHRYKSNKMVLESWTNEGKAYTVAYTKQVVRQITTTRREKVWTPFIDR